MRPWATSKLCFSNLLAALWLLLILTTHVTAGETDWPTNALSLVDCINLALAHNSSIQRSQSEVQAAHGIVIQTRAIALPKVQLASDYQKLDESSIDKLPLGGLESVPNLPAFSLSYANQNWATRIRLVQSLYEGGRIASSLRSARLIQEQAVLNHEIVISDALLLVRIAYDDVLVAEQQIAVQEASVKLLTLELTNTTRRFDAGTVPKFNVLRAEVELANARPRLIKARNSYRIAKNNLVNHLGFHVPPGVGEDVPLQLTGKLTAEPYELDLPILVSRALIQRPELTSLRKSVSLDQESVKSTRAGYLPSLQAVGGYSVHSSSFNRDVTDVLHGWFVGAQLTWDVFDGRLTEGKVLEARARVRQSEINLDGVTRRIELEVRTAYSNFIEAKEVLESQKKVLEQAEEALRLANARYDAGTGTQLDLLGAQTSLTEARSTQVQALHDYSVARTRLERAVGESLFQSQSNPTNPGA